mmetsp:Transcript_4797/g.11391  ORF Transcript_4797/g.11391 Transcript_4797/m.11391 type:complete len:360 (+) Transcript_4797:18-1097(+)
MSGLQELVSSAFGNNASLYKDVLKCSSKATPSELRKAYHKRALLYHPDKLQDASESRVQEATLKFQALSATYKLLSDSFQRALYDSTGRIPSSVDEDDHDPSGASTTTNSNGRTRKNKNTDEWVRFFQSVFQDMVNAGSNFDRKEYCRSQQEREDVLKFYQLCKGNRPKMMSCIVQAEEEDFDRWWKDIIQPAIQRGDMETYEKASSIDTDEAQKKKRKKLGRKRKRPETKVPKQQEEDSSPAANGGDLEDTDDEEDDTAKSSSIRKSSKTMSRREKMEFRVAKKRKEKQEREIEIAGIMQSKQWTAGSFGKAAAAKQGRAKGRNKHGLSDSFLSGLQTKFSSSESVPSRKKKSRIKRK